MIILPHANRADTNEYYEGGLGGTMLTSIYKEPIAKSVSSAECFKESK